MSIAPISYNPDVNDTLVLKNTGIGITFDHRILSGSGDITIREDSGSGTVVGTFDVTDSDSVTIQGRKAIINPSLSSGKTYHINYPSGCFTNTGGDVSYVGTAYTFTTTDPNYEMWTWGSNAYGNLGLNQGGTGANSRSSPVQLPGTWSNVTTGRVAPILAGKPNGTLFAWGRGLAGGTGVNNQTYYSSPVQIPGTTWTKFNAGTKGVMGRKSDGTLWTWGRHESGGGGYPGGSYPSGNSYRSSPTQIPGTYWISITSSGNSFASMKLA